jgi:hypothetical protein|tara:strand:- start:1691 stop:1900 length:210 start_codon:yes stop_codon:yes gene_type:complete
MWIEVKRGVQKWFEAQMLILNTDTFEVSNTQTFEASFEASFEGKFLHHRNRLSVCPKDFSYHNHVGSSY